MPSPTLVVVVAAAVLAASGAAVVPVSGTASDQHERARIADPPHDSPVRTRGGSGPMTASRSGGQVAFGRAPATGGLPGTARSTRWTWPLRSPTRVLRGFSPPAQRWLPGHRGVDLAALPGDEVLAAGAGRVTFAGMIAGRGVVTVAHGELRTTYEPVGATVVVGQRVAAGSVIGAVVLGTGHCSGYPPCLHWGLRRGDDYLDPLLLVTRGTAVLLPLLEPQPR